MNLYYIDGSKIPDKNPHSKQINVNCEILNKKIKNFKLICFKGYKKNNYDSETFNRPKIFNKIIPLSIFYLIYKIKNIKIKKDSNLITRNPFIAYYYSKKFKNVILELHTYPIFKKNPISYLLFDILLYIYPINKIKSINNIKIGVISKGLYNKLLSKKIKKENLFIIPDGVDIKKFDIILDKKQALKKLNLKFNDDNVIISYVGTTNKNRDLKTLINVSTYFPNIIFIVYGDKQKYLTIADKKINNFYYNGYTDFAEIVYKGSDILFGGYTKKIKTIEYMSPLKIFEYMASNKPIILSDFPRNKEILNNKEAYYYKSENYKSLILTINKCLIDIEHQNSKTGYLKVKDYSWDKRIDKIINKLK